MSWRLVLNTVPPIHVRPYRTSQHAPPTRALSSFRKHFPSTACPPAHCRNRNLTVTDFDVMPTWILAPNQTAARAKHGACILHLRVRSGMTLEKKPNNEHYILNAATSCADGLKIKRHTICVATHIVCLLALLLDKKRRVSEETTACRRIRGNNRHKWKRSRPQPKC